MEQFDRVKLFEDGDKNTLDAIVWSGGLYVIISPLPCSFPPDNRQSAHYEFKEEEKEEGDNENKPSLFFLLKDPDSRIINFIKNYLSLFNCCCTICTWFFSSSNSAVSPSLYENIWFLAISRLSVKAKLSQDLLSSELLQTFCLHVFDQQLSGLPCVLHRLPGKLQLTGNQSSAVQSSLSEAAVLILFCLSLTTKT